MLDLIRISRTEMGAYLCIAQNGVPPSISKRIILTVECKWKFQVALTVKVAVGYLATASLFNCTTR